MMGYLGKYLFSLLAVVTVGAASVNAADTGVIDSAATFAGEAISIDVLENDLGTSLSITSVDESSVGWGRVTINENKKSVTYTPHPDYIGHDEFWYVFENTSGTLDSAKVIVSVSDRSWPVANYDTVSANYNEIISIPVLANDVGVELKVVSVNEWSTDKGKVWVDENNTVKYQQVGEPRGDLIDEFWYVFEDKWERSNAAKVVVSLSESAGEAWPTANPDIAEAKNGLRAFIPVLANDIGTGLKLTSTNAWTQQGGKTVIVDNVIRYTPPSGFTGIDVFWYVFEDDQGRTNSAKVEVAVTQNTALSVVEFCGSTYESDGSLENTVITTRSETPSGNKYLALNHTDFTHGGAVVDGRRYTRESVSTESGYQSTIWMQIAGVRSKVVEGDAGETIYSVGAFNKHFYYVRSNKLFAHDGQITTELTHWLEGHVGLSDDVVPTYRVSSEVHSGELYIRAISSISGAWTVKNSYWRVSDGLGLELVFLGSSVSDYVDTLQPDYVQRIKLKQKYFNGLDYYAYSATVGDEPDLTSQTFEVVQQDREAVLYKIPGLINRFVESNNRLFALTSSHYETVGGERVYKQGKLYVIDNSDDSFVELATCTSAEL